MYSGLEWLPECPEARDGIRIALANENPERAFHQFQQLANSRMDFVATTRLDKAVQRYEANHGRPPSMTTVRLALLGSSTLGHLHAAIRVAALRRGILLEIYEGPYGMYRQEVSDRSSGLYAFQPDVVCFSLDAHHAVAASSSSASQMFEDLRHCWRLVAERLKCAIIQQTVLPVHLPLIGNQENRFPRSPAAVVQQVNQLLRTHAEVEGIYLLTADTWAAFDGIVYWHDPALWHYSRQEVHPRASNAYGEHIARIIAALRGKSAKCLVLDLDNTLWGGVIGDDGLEGIVLGQGSTVGEAHLDLQHFALQLSERGVILAVCSKNDEENAVTPFDQHAEMILRRKHIACFVANWNDKAKNLRHIAATLKIGLDSLVFVDDNPVERALVRRELPMVAVPELPEDVSGYVRTIASAGYFEALYVTEDDRARAEQYRANTERSLLHSTSTDMVSFLAALNMELIWSEFDAIGIQRIAQLIHKSNQFNLTTRRYTDADILSMLSACNMLTLQLRLKDTYGDNGVIALLVGRGNDDATLEMDAWLMSCRVLGRGVEQASLNILVERARAAGYQRIVGVYKPTAKNGMVRDHYRHLGFEHLQEAEDGSSRWLLEVCSYVPTEVPISIKEGDECRVITSIAA